MQSADPYSGSSVREQTVDISDIQLVSLSADLIVLAKPFLYLPTPFRGTSYIMLKMQASVFYILVSAFFKLYVWGDMGYLRTSLAVERVLSYVGCVALLCSFCVL